MEHFYLERRHRSCSESTKPEFNGRSREGHHVPRAASELQSHSVQTISKLPFSSDEKQSSSSGENSHSNEFPTFPSKMMILELLIQSLKHPRRPHDINDLDDSVSEGSFALSPSEKMVVESICEFVLARTKPKTTSFFLPGAKMRKIRSRSHIRTQMEVLDLISISTETCETSPGASSLKKMASELNMHENMLFSCSKTATSSLTVGLLHCMWKDGLPHFEFSLDDPAVVYRANPIMVQSSNDKALAYIYLFHSLEQGRKDWTKSRCVGKMKVSSSFTLNSDESGLTETEFVLFGSGDDYHRQMQSSSSVTKSKGLAKRVKEMIRADGFISSLKHSQKLGKSCSQQLNLSGALGSEFSSVQESTLTNFIVMGDSPTDELAAIVVQEHGCKLQRAPLVGGWGLKFLQKAGHTYSESSGSTDVQSRKGTGRHINVIVPRGYHGGVGAAIQDGGPSSLTERWRSGGHCDCGGWDLGCPIKVLNNGYSLLQKESHDCKSLDLLLEGSEKGKPMLRLMNITEELHLIYFHSSMSPVQCFSAGIAIIHSQTPNHNKQF